MKRKHVVLFAFYFNLCTIIFSVDTVKAQEVVLYENANFTGKMKTLGIGTYRFNSYADFNDMASSIKVPQGFAVMLFEHADEGGGYGVSVDLMEDCTDLLIYNFDDKISYLTVFNARPGNGFLWVRAAITNGVFVAGHWERERANGNNPVNATTGLVSPPFPPHTPQIPTVLQVNGAQTVITALGVQSSLDQVMWEHASTNQMGIIGNDYRGIDEIGSAAIERGSNNIAIPDNLNFWYPQKRPNDRRDVVYYKRTLAGKVVGVKQVKIDGTFPDYDVNVDIEPADKYRYLLTESHSREYTSLMSKQWHLSGHTSGQPDCDDAKSKNDFKHIEAEIAETYWPQKSRKFSPAILTGLCTARVGQDICVYGPWIYDAGHCCHAEIHPSEQIWWTENNATGKKYACNVLCDASKRFFWRDQMDDGTKLKPWAAPPVKGLFAIAFEIVINDAGATPIKKFEVSDIKKFNVAKYPDADKVYELTFQNKTLVSFVPHNDAFKVSYESVGLVPGTINTIRGFLVIETSVGTIRQIATSKYFLDPGSNKSVKIKFPMGTDPINVPPHYERKFFSKVSGNYLFNVIETTLTPIGN